MLTDHFSQSGSNPPPGKTRFTHMNRRMDIQTDGDYIKRVVHGPPGDHTLKNGIGPPKPKDFWQEGWCSHPKMHQRGQISFNCRFLICPKIWDQTHAWALVPISARTYECTEEWLHQAPPTPKWSREQKRMVYLCSSQEIRELDAMTPKAVSCDSCVMKHIKLQKLQKKVSSCRQTQIPLIFERQKTQFGQFQIYLCSCFCAVVAINLLRWWSWMHSCRRKRYNNNKIMSGGWQNINCELCRYRIVIFERIVQKTRHLVVRSFCWASCAHSQLDSAKLNSRLPRKSETPRVHVNTCTQMDNDGKSFKSWCGGVCLFRCPHRRVRCSGDC